jgi:hypothetical protein
MAIKPIYGGKLTMDEKIMCGSREPDLQRALGLLSRSESHFDELLGDLEERLSGLMRPDQPNPISPEGRAKEDILVPVAEDLKDLSRRIQGRKERIQSVLDRLEV